MKLRNIHEEIVINVTQETMWKVLSRYGDVSQFHAGVEESYHVEGSVDEAALGGERVCNIFDMGLHIVLKERIFNYIEGSGYQYEVYEWKNFPLRKMLFGFSIKKNSDNSTILMLDIDYKAKPAFLTPLMAPKMHRLAKDVLLGYKHFTETGERKVPIKSLRKLYRDIPQVNLQYA
jgi:hypothetical protein